MNPYEKGIVNFNDQLSLRLLEMKRLAPLARTKYDGVVICGMGGSALAGGILQMTRRDVGLELPVVVWRDYDLPEETGMKHPLYIFSSFSGNTEETISGLKKALSRGHARKVAVVTSGGALLRIAESKKLATITFRPDPDLQPRQATGYMYYALLGAMKGAGIKVKAPSFAHINPRRFKSQGAALAKKLKADIITIYTSTSYAPLGQLWKAKLSEGAKIFAFPHVVPEMNHVELVSYEGKRNPRIASLFLLDDAMHPRTKKRFSIMRYMLATHGARVAEISLTGHSRLEEVWDASMLADWTALSLARARRVSPLPIDIVEEFKALMKK